MSDTMGPDPRDPSTWPTRGWRTATVQLRRIDGLLGTRRRAKLYGTISVEWRVGAGADARRFDSCELLDVPRSKAAWNLLLPRCQAPMPSAVTNGSEHLTVVVNTRLSIKKLRRKRDIRLGHNETTLNATLSNRRVTQRVSGNGKTYEVELEISGS